MNAKRPVAIALGVMLVIGVVAVFTLVKPLGLLRDFLQPPRPTAVFLIVVDTLRPDRLSCYGYTAHTTTHIDRLASLGVRFTRAHSVASWTSPSMGAMLTSRYPTQLGLVELPAPPGVAFEWRKRRRQLSYVLPPEVPTLAELLRRVGYRTGGFVDQPALNARGGFRRGFEDWYSPVGPGRVERYEAAEKFHRQEWASTLYAHQSDWALAREFDGWLAAREPNERLFAWIHLLTPHRPYKPEPRYAPPQPKDGGQKPSPSQRYDGEVRAVDDMIGAIVGSIERYVGLSRSLIVFTSDHGEAFGEHGMTEHGHSLHGEVIRVPLILVAPSLPAGATVQRHVRTIDLLPTVLDLTGRLALAPADIAGTSLVPYIQNDASLPVYAEAMLYGSTERSLIDHGYKLMYDQQGEEYSLFNVVNDPEELIDLAARQPQRTASMRKRLKEFHAELLDDLRRRLSTDRDVRSAEQKENERRRALEALRSLGYVGD